jgi:predicted RND superfamily exporter protein
MNWRVRTEKKFEHFSDFIFDNRKKVITSILLIVLVMATQLPNLTMDTSTEGFLHKSDPMRVAYDEFRDQFGRDEKFLVAVKTKDIFDYDFLKKLAELHLDLENNLPYVDDVNSLLNARNTFGTEESLIVEDLFEDFEVDKNTLADKKRLALQNPLLKNLLFNEDATFTNLIIDTQTYSSLDKNGDEIVLDEEDEFSDEVDTFQADKRYLTDAENTKIIEKVQEIVAKYESDNFTIYLAGSALFNGVIKQAMKEDTQGFIQKMVVMVILVLFLMFRRISGVVLPLLAVVLTIISTMSAMAFFGAPFTVVTQIMPSFLLAVITGGSIHLLAIFYNDFATSEDVKTSLRHTMSHSGLAIVMTSLTTAAGMWSFSFSQVAPVANLGKFASIGIIMGLLYILILLPALLSLVPIKHKPPKKQGSAMDKILLAISDFALIRAKSIVIVSGFLIAITMFFAVQMQFSHHPLLWFDKESPVRIAIETIDDKLNGSMTIEVLVDTQKENGLYEPSILNKIDQAKRYLIGVRDQDIFVGKALNITDILKETNKALNASQQQFYKIPQEKNVIAQELFLFSNSGSDDLEDFVDSQFSKARLTLKMPYVDAIKFNHFLDEISLELNQIFAQDAQISFTGIGVLLSSIMEKSIHSSAISYVLAFTLIAIMMIILIGDIKIGLLSMIPNTLPIMVLIAIMVVFNVPLDMFSMLVGAIALGLAVDDTVHFMHNFRRYQLQGNSVDESVRLTMLGTGRAIVVTSVVLSLGFLVLLTASMTNMFHFGVLTASAIFVALIADLLLVPAMMKLMSK